MTREGRAGRAPEAGFTLIEALVAMAVLAVGAISLLGVSEGHAVRIGDVTDRVVARWVAEERLAQARLGLEPEPGAVEMLGRRWEATTGWEATEDDDLRRLTVEVGPAGSGPIVTLMAYVDATTAPDEPAAESRP